MTSPASGPDDRARRLEPEREHADQEVASGAQLGVGHRRVADPVELGEEVDDRRDRDLGVDGGARGERPGARRRSKPAPAP